MSEDAGAAYPVPIAALNQYAFCPYRAWLMFVEGEFADNEHTLAGTIEHELVHDGGHTSRPDVTTLRAVHLASDRLGLVGVADVIERTPEGHRPVEYKHGTHGNWENDALQVCAQAMCLEDALARSGAPERIEAALLWYHGSRRRIEVRCDDALRARVVEVAEAVRMMLRDRKRPERDASPKRCAGCSLRRACLPDEVGALRSGAVVNMKGRKG